MNYKKLLLASCTGLAVLSLGATYSQAAITQFGADAANDPVYADGWDDGDNGGTGFSSWAFPETNAKYSIASSTGLAAGAPDIDTDGKSFRSLNDGNSGYIHAERDLAAPLNPGDQFSMTMSAFEDADKNAGFNIESAGGGALVYVNFPYGTGDNVIGIRYPGGGVGPEFAGLTEATSFYITVLQKTDSAGTITVSNNTSGVVISGEYTGVMGRVSLFARPDAEATDSDAMYFNSFILESGYEIPAEPLKEDFANDPVYDDGWANGDNGGYGFASWSFSGWSDGETSIGDSTDLHASVDINTDGKCFRAISTNDYLQTLRDFGASMSVGQTFSIDFAAGESGNNQGFAVRAKGSTVNSAGIVTLSNRIGDGGWTVTAAETEDFIDDSHKVAAANTWFHLEFTQETLDGGSYSITRYGEITGTMEGTYTGQIGAFKFYCSVAGDNAMYFNNMMLTDPIDFEITGFALNGANAEISFTSEEGKIYKIQGCDDLLADSWTDLSALIEGVPPANTNTVSMASSNFLRVKEAVRFFDDFEGDTSGWTLINEAGAEWEIGLPTTTNENLVVTNAYSPTMCAGTVLDGLYGINSVSSLRTPIIDLGSATKATLSYFECASVENYDMVTINILDENGENPVELLSYGGDDTLPNLLISSWTERSLELPMESIPTKIMIEFVIDADNVNVGDYSGWYIDDVSVN